MEDTDKESKTENPTEKRLKDSADEGKTPVSKEIATAVTIGSFSACFILVGEEAAKGLSDLLAGGVDMSVYANSLSNSDFLVLILYTAQATAILLGPLLLVLFATSILSSIVQNEPRLIVKRISPQFSRISLKSGVRRLFSIRSMVEFLKSLSKVSAAIFILVTAMKPSLAGLFSTIHQTPGASLLFLSNLTGKLLVWMTGISALIALADYFWQRHDWWSELKMSRQELKEEFKQSEGDPVIKGRLLSIGRARARARMMQAVPGSTLIVANPTHFAVALRYDKDRDAAPIVVAKGMDIIALRIREIAKANSVPVFERVDLARALYKSVGVDQVIPKHFYAAIAELIRAVYDKRFS